MFRFINMIRSGTVSPDPISVLFHYIRGEMVNWANGKDGPTRWVADSHRGVQWLDKVVFPRKQKRYIFSPLFELRFDTAFEEVIRSLRADITREGRTWICEPLIQGLIGLHKMGFAHSYEAWNEGKLIGGAFGMQLGSMLTCDSMFHRMSNASKSAYGQMLVHIQERGGFKIVDTNGVATHQVNYGEEWMPAWQFQKQVFTCLADAPALTDDRPCPALPWEVKAMLPMLRATRVITRRLPRFGKPAAAPPTAADAPAGSDVAPAKSESEEAPAVAAPPTPTPTTRESTAA